MLHRTRNCVQLAHPEGPGYYPTLAHGAPECTPIETTSLHPPDTTTDAAAEPAKVANHRAAVDRIVPEALCGAATDQIPMADNVRLLSVSHDEPRLSKTSFTSSHSRVVGDSCRSRDISALSREITVQQFCAPEALAF